MRIIISCIMFLFTACGSGMIGLLPDKTGRLVMSGTFVIEHGGSIYTIEVSDYYEPDVLCEGLKPLTIVPDWTELNVWMDSREMDNGYIGPVQELLHEEYYNSVCGG